MSYSMDLLTRLDSVMDSDTVQSTCSSFGSQNTLFVRMASTRSWNRVSKLFSGWNASDYFLQVE